MQLNYLNKPHFENGSIKSISEVLKEHGIKKPLICTDPGLASIGMSDKIRNLLSNDLRLFTKRHLPIQPNKQSMMP
jgi:alcohol dehydrogenase class IV